MGFFTHLVWIYWFLVLTSQSEMYPFTSGLKTSLFWALSPLEPDRVLSDCFSPVSISFLRLDDVLAVLLQPP